MAERWNGRKWTIQPMPRTGFTNSELLAVSCWTAKGCIAVGDAFGTGSGTLLAERWNGNVWTIQRNATLGSSTLGSLQGISCVSAQACIAVGNYGAERWNGKKWTIERVPQPSGGETRELVGVSCTSADACMAVGDYMPDSYTSKTLAERWDGRKWTIQHPPTHADSQLDGVSCTSARACTAVDDAGPLTERWNGTRWIAEHTPIPVAARYRSTLGLSGVSCLSPSRCTAVGYYLNGPGLARTLAERWTGQSSSRARFLGLGYSRGLALNRSDAACP
jgi:hypothetical protein